MSKSLQSFKSYRFIREPKEKELHDKFNKTVIKDNRNMADKIIFGTKDDYQAIPTEYLTDREKRIMLGTVQWLGSNVGQSFLRECGFKLKQISQP